jgi:hypothetical protein
MPLAALAFMTAVAAPATAETLNFADLAAADGGAFNSVPSGYGGIQTWMNFGSINTTYWPSYQNTPVSGTGVLFDNYENVVTLANPTAFTINDFYIAAANYSPSDDLTFTAYSGGTQIDTESITVGSTPTDVVLNWSGVTSFTIATYYHGTTSPAYFGLGEMTLNGSESVPEPTTAALLGVGLAGLLGARRRKASRAK